MQKKSFFDFIFRPPVELPSSDEEEEEKSKEINQLVSSTSNISINSTKPKRRSSFENNDLLPSENKRISVKKEKGIKNIGKSDFFDDISETSSRFLTILNDPTLLIAFRDFLQQSLSVENLDFWLFVEKFKNAPNQEIQKETAKLIIDKFFSESSLSEISSSGRAKAKVMEQYSSGIITPDMFNEIQESVFLVLLDDAYPRFKNSPYFKDSTIQKRQKFPTLRNAVLKNQINENPNEIIQKVINLNEPDCILSNLKLTETPSILASSSIYLYRLDLSENLLTNIPGQIIVNNLLCLTELYLDCNQLTSVPNEIVFLQKLAILSVNYNNLSSLPPELGKIKTLQAIRIFGNPRFQEIPCSIVKLNHLIEFRHDNQLFKIPIQSIIAESHLNKQTPPPESETSNRISKTLNRSEIKKTFTSDDASIPSSRLNIISSILNYIYYLRPFNVTFSQKSHLKKKSEAEACSLCNCSFKTMNIKHNCHLCGEIFCKRCSNNRVKLRLLNYSDFSRVCNYCMAYLHSNTHRYYSF